MEYTGWDDNGAFVPRENFVLLTTLLDLEKWIRIQVINSDHMLFSPRLSERLGLGIHHLNK